MKAVETILLENIDNPDSLFVFPTDIAASRWADHLLRLKGGTIAVRNFTAWDKFKQSSIKSKVQNKKSVPSALRKIFVHSLVIENAEAAANGEKTIFTSLISVEWAGLSSQPASQFTPWLTRILPQLGAWFKAATGSSIDCILDKNAETLCENLRDGEKDMYNMALRYARFLDAHSLFEPAWETPPFNNDGKEVFLFFPESLSDYREYGGLLSASGHVKIISAACGGDYFCDTFFYTNSRSEITEAALYIRALHEKKNISWDSIAVCVPDSANYEPYVLREFLNRNIPYVKRISKPLRDYPAGRFFHSVLECVSRDFSFSSVSALIRNKNLPWKESALIDKLIQFGIDNNCLCSWTEEDNIEKKINVWEDAFSQPAGYKDESVQIFFNNLKRRVLSLRGSRSFVELRRQYFIFSENFFDMEKCGKETDLILSRCITELMSLADLEKSFPLVTAADPLLFLTEYLSEAYYLPQAEYTGVAILPYKTAAAAPFDCHIILGAGEENLSVINKHMEFLPKKRRAELGVTDEDASMAFINMHKFNSVRLSAFFCCEKSFTGYSIPHSKINSPAEPRDRYAPDADHSEKFSRDLYIAESHMLSSLSRPCEENEITLHESQARGFTEWRGRRYTTTDLNKKNSFNNKKIREIIDEYYTPRNPPDEKNKKYMVSATSLQKYFQCSLKWFFERVLALENSRIDTGLMSENISGLVYHAILNNFFIKIKNTGSPLADAVYEGSAPALPDNYLQALDKSIDEVFSFFPMLKPNGAREMSSLSARLLRAGKKDYQYNLRNCLAHFLSFFAGCSVAASECYYQTEKESYILRGCVDCVLKEPPRYVKSAPLNAGHDSEPECQKADDAYSDNEEKYIIVDFKLKKTPSRAVCTADEKPLADFQLPVYITLAEENDNYKAYTALFYSILDHKSEVIIGKIYDEKTEKEIPRDKDQQIIRGSEWYNAVFDEFKNKTKQFTREISSGEFSVYPEKSGDCINCGFLRICRTVYIIGRENNLLEKS